MFRWRTVCFLMAALFLSASTNAENTNVDKNIKSEQKENSIKKYKDIILKEHLLLFNIQVASISGTFGKEIKYVDNAPFAKLIFGGFVSYDKMYSYKYTIGANLGYFINEISDIRSHAFSFSGNFSFYLKGYKSSPTYFKTEIGFIKAIADSSFIDATSDNISTNFIPFYKIGLGTHGLLGNNGALRFEIFYQKVLSNNKKIPEIDNYQIDGNLSSIGLTVGLGLSW